MYEDRVKLYKKIEKLRGSKVVTYVTGDKPNMEMYIYHDVISFFADHLDILHKRSKKISLILYSNGGATLAAWNIVNLIKMFFDDFEVIVPSVARSAATLMSIGADKIIMSKQATLGPIDPSINSMFGPPNPFIPGTTFPVSVEDVGDFFELAKREVGTQVDLQKTFELLTEKIHPLALGSVSRSRDQIKMLASRFLKHHMADEKQRAKVIKFLCSESGSHDYTINRREAERDLGLPIEKPSEELYKIIQDIYIDFREEMELRKAFNPFILLGGREGSVSYSVTRALIESVEGGADQFKSEGVVMNMAPILQQLPGQPMQVPMPSVFDQRTKEEWVHVSAK